MATVTLTEEKLKDRTKELKEAVAGKDLESALKNVKKLDNTCAFTKCKARTTDFAITCKHCNSRFCPTHCLPEIHGCGEAVRREERRKFLHPEPKLTAEKHSQAQTKLTVKLKQMQLERKAKPGAGGKSKKK